MDEQGKGTSETVEFNNEVYDDVCFGDIFSMIDLPVDNLDGDGLAEDWALKLGPIPSEVFREVPIGGGGGDGGGNEDLLTGCSVLNTETSQQKRRRVRCGKPFKSTSSFPKENKPNPKPHPLLKFFEPPSPDSVLTSGPTGKPVLFRTRTRIPVRARTKRSRPPPTANPWAALLIPLRKLKKKRPDPTDPPPPDPTDTKKCAHCEITKTPQWREGPLGPKTLCNACGVRYRSGRLFPEYRPAASPTFIPSVHSNSHRKVIEMRQKGGGGMDDRYVGMKKKPWVTTTRNCSSE